MSLLKSAIFLRCDNDFWLEGTLCGGQCFRWTRLSDGCCAGVLSGRAITITRMHDGVEISGDERPDAKSFWQHYLDLDTDYAAIRDSVLSIEPRLADAARRCGGVHILNQDAWEALCCFIISQNNNIPRIRSIVERLCLLCGEPVEQGCGAPFPSADAVAALTEQQLTDIGCGYRASYILGAARLVAGSALDLERLRHMPLAQAREALLSVRGIGPKVADCVLLFGLHRLECFPRDVWINRALAGDFKNTPLVASPYAGVAQQYIFEYIRSAATAQ